MRSTADFILQEGQPGGTEVKRGRSRGVIKEAHGYILPDIPYIIYRQGRISPSPARLSVSLRFASKQFDIGLLEHLRVMPVKKRQVEHSHRVFHETASAPVP